MSLNRLTAKLFEFSPTWSCVSLTRSTTSSEWKLFRFGKTSQTSELPSNNDIAYHHGAQLIGGTNITVVLVQRDVAYHWHTNCNGQLCELHELWILWRKPCSSIRIICLRTDTPVFRHSLGMSERLVANCHSEKAQRQMCTWPGCDCYIGRKRKRDIRQNVVKAIFNVLKQKIY